MYQALRDIVEAYLEDKGEEPTQEHVDSVLSALLAQ